MADRLPTELLVLIGYKLDSTGDRIRFRAVSKAWMRALPFRQPPWLVMYSRSQNHLIQLISAGDQSICCSSRRMDMLPEIHRAAAASASGFVGSQGNWLITVHSSDKSILLSNPFSKIQLHLPSRMINHHEMIESIVTPSGSTLALPIIRKVVLSDPVPDPPHDTSTGTGDCIALSHWGSNLVVVGPGDASWTALTGYPNMDYLAVEDFIFFRRQCYAITSRGKLVVWDVRHGLVPPPQLKFLLDCFIDDGMPSSSSAAARKHYLVECSGELLVVVRFLDKHLPDINSIRDNFTTNAFKTYKVDFADMKLDDFKSLGDHSLFLGLNSSVSVLASDYFGLVRRNCIYFADDLVCLTFMDDDAYSARLTKNDIGVFDLEDNRITPHYKGTSASTLSQSLWIVPA